MDEERIRQLEDQLQSVLGTDVTYRKVCKMNSVTADAFEIGDGNTKSIAYFNAQWSDEFIVHHVKQTLESVDSNITALEDKVTQLMNNREYVLQNVERSVIGTQLNKGNLEKYIHREYLDLSVIYRVIVSRGDDCRRSAVITKALAEHLNLTIEELERASVMNKGVECYISTSVEKVLVESGVIPEGISSFKNDEFYPMYVISTEDGIDGATSILHTSLFGGLATVLKSDLFILPSSMDELICIPDQGQPVSFLREMVASVNRDTVAADKVLGSNVYRYSRKKKAISIAV